MKASVRIIVFSALAASAGSVLLWVNLERLTHCSPQSIRAKVIGKNLGVISKQLKIGMTKSEVARILGQPQNHDADHVWMWINDYETYLERGQQLRWNKMLTSSRDDFFLVFIDSRLATGIYANSAATPAQALKAEKGITTE